MILKECMLIKNKVYTNNVKITNGQPTGIVVHSTGSNNPWLKRYTQPVPEQEYYKDVIGDIGKNTNGNSWNRSSVTKCVHAMIGKNAEGVIETYQTLPWNICCGGVWRGRLLYAGAPCYEDATWKKIICYTDEDLFISAANLKTMANQGYCMINYNGKDVYVLSNYLASYNYNPTAHLQFEIQEDSMEDEAYFNAAFKEAQELCAYWCKEFNLAVDTICSHDEAYKAGYGTQHNDPNTWLKRFGKDMDWFRAEVQKLLDAEQPEEPEPIEPEEPEDPTYQFAIGDEVQIKDGVTTWANGKSIKQWLLSWEKPLYVRGFKEEGTKTVISTLSEGDISGTMWTVDLEPYNKEDDGCEECCEEPTNEKGEVVQGIVLNNEAEPVEPVVEPVEPIVEPDKTEEPVVPDTPVEPVDPIPEPIIEPDNTDEGEKKTFWDFIKWIFDIIVNGIKNLKT